MNVRKVKLLDGGLKGLVVNYSESVLVGGFVAERVVSMRSELPVHNDLLESVEGMRFVLLEVLGLRDDRRVLFTGFSLSGDGDSEACVVTGKIKTLTTPIGVSTPRIIIGGVEWGIEDAVRGCLEKCVIEVELYLKKMKSGQMSIDFDDDGRGDDVMDEIDNAFEEDGDAFEEYKKVEL